MLFTLFYLIRHFRLTICYTWTNERGCACYDTSSLRSEFGRKIHNCPANVYCAIFITSSSVNLPENTISVSSSLSSTCMTTADCCLVI